MNGLSTCERIVLEIISSKNLNFNEILNQSGLPDHVALNVIQKLVTKGFIQTDGFSYFINEKISPGIIEEINYPVNKAAESLEQIEAILHMHDNKLFRFQKVALDNRDEKIFLAMLSNIESFIKDANKKSGQNMPLKEKKIIFWGLSSVDTVLNQMIQGSIA